MSFQTATRPTKRLVWFGRVAKPEYTDEEVEAITVSTVGERNYDGFLYAIKK